MMLRHSGSGRNHKGNPLTVVRGSYACPLTDVRGSYECPLTVVRGSSIQDGYVL